MKAFKKVQALTFKKNKVALIIITALVLLISINTINSKRERIYYNTGLNFYYNVDKAFDEEGKLKKEYMDNDMFSDLLYSSYSKFASEYKDGIPEDYYSKMEDKYQKIKENYKIKELDDGSFDYEEQAGEEKSTVMSILSGRYIVFNNLDIVGGKLKYNYGFELFYPDFIVIIGFFISFLLLSGEHLTSYYEFTRMLPFSKQASWLYKYVFGLVYLLILYLIVTGSKYLAYSTSIFIPVVNLSPSFLEVAYSLLTIVAFYTMAMGVEALAGNFLGHIGLLAMAIAGLELIEINFYGLVNAFFGPYSALAEYANKFSEWLGDLPEFIKPLAMPIEISVNANNLSQSVVIGLVIMAVVYFILGIVFTRRAKGERSQMLILSKPESDVVRVIAIITTANLIANITGMFADVSAFIRGLTIVIFFLGIYLSYKFYNFLFKAKIGLN